jgi:hypothetical protein
LHAAGAARRLLPQRGMLNAQEEARLRRELVIRSAATIVAALAIITGTLLIFPPDRATGVSLALRVLVGLLPGLPILVLPMLLAARRQPWRSRAR